MALRSIAAAFNRFQYTSMLPDSHFFGADSYSPRTIVLQIATLQGFYYITAIILQYSTSLLLGLKFSLSWTFSWKPVTLDNSLGWAIIGIWLFTSFISVLFLTFVVGRSKLAWDFALTIHLINLVIVWAYEGEFPFDLYWWILQIVSSLILVSLGTWSTRWKELRDTFFEGIVDPELGNVNHRSNIIEMTDNSTINPKPIPPMQQ
ncbi:hypothetical protein WICMUC_005730 [Wickerhamomyces mucosus]|uniref:Protein SYS1 n=1 Tax=Wickerhamomyces mucosus TaxID=1378264 RepID=A0A9P8P3E1_9ASCO|nr:hypothetical protein WICMUC_005730 [Wickerhamomyces mucosus]